MLLLKCVYAVRALVLSQTQFTSLTEGLGIRRQEEQIKHVSPSGRATILWSIR